MNRSVMRQMFGAALAFVLAVAIKTREEARRIYDEAREAISFASMLAASLEALARLAEVRFVARA